ncbi:MAG: helix-turn-helix transcriptional regulator [Spirochaetes bacterium]|nr:helix-turn-helix transcriptional regulator [Spirochaetota bacterium]
MPVRNVMTHNPSIRYSLHETGRIFTAANPVWSDTVNSGNWPVTPLHYHAMFEIQIWKGARGTLTVDGGMMQSGVHSVYLFTPGKLHGFQLLPGAGTVTTIQVSLHAAQSVFDITAFGAEMGADWSHLPVVSGWYDKHRDVFLRLAASPGTGAGAVYRELAAVFAMLPAAIERRGPVMKPDDFLRKVIAFTSKRFREMITLDDVARAVGLSRTYFCRAFKKRAGTTWITYLTNLRLEESIRLMQQGASVTDACFGSGFNDLSYFIETFKRFQKVTPLRFVKTKLRTKL